MHTTSPLKARLPINRARTALHLAEQTSLWEPLIAFDPASRYYARLAKQAGFEAWLLTWVPGQGTDWHDHGGSAGAFVILRGSLCEEHAVVDPDRRPVVQRGSQEVAAGALRTFGRQHVHRVTNRSSDSAVSLHVYSPALVEMTQYAVRGDYLQPVSSQTAGVNW
jgi:predicted metal-dependent enzyme (double-stranded beta helix superfamily)